MTACVAGDSGTTVCVTVWTVWAPPSGARAPQLPQNVLPAATVPVYVLPFTVSVKSGPPAGTDAGDNPLVVGSGFGLGAVCEKAMSSTPRSQPAVKLTVTVVEGCVHPVFTSCIVPTVMAWVLVWPRLSVSVSVPAVGVNTRMLLSTRGAGENVNVRDVPVAESK